MDERHDEQLWDAVRSGLVTTDDEREAREDALAVASAEVALMRLSDRGARCDSVTLHVAGEVVSGCVQVWTGEVVVVEGSTCWWAVRMGAIDVIEGLPRALCCEGEAAPSTRSILDRWAGAQVEVVTASGGVRGPLVVAADHLELGAAVIPWDAVRVVRRPI